MKRRFFFLPFICALVISGIVVLQLAWLNNYYKLNKERFEKDVNLAFEDGIKKEFKVRCDTLEYLLCQFLADSNHVRISSKWSDKYKQYVYWVVNKKDTTDGASFSLKAFNKPILHYHDSVEMEVIRRYAGMYRSEDLERHIIFFRTQELGAYIGKKADEYGFDTTRLRPIFAACLADRGIFETFHFSLRDSDNTLNRNDFPDSMRHRFAVITKSFPTYKNEKNGNFVRAMFGAPRKYLFGRMIWMLIGSLTLLLLMCFLLYYLVNIIRKEKRISAIKNDFISNISHELKTPVATVSAAIEALAHFNMMEHPAKAKRYLDISKTELQRLADMVNKILNISLYEKQAFELKLEMVNIDEVVHEVIQNHAMSSEHQAGFHYCNHTSTTVIRADRLHLYNVINNLVDNAVKYSGVGVKVDMGLYQQDGYYILSVRDNGPGISRQHLPLIFEKFYRVPTGNLYKVKGYGLGLSYVKNIMVKHGGWCSADSQPGNGSTFKLGFLS